VTTYSGDRGTILGDGPVNVPPGDERDRGPGGLAVQVDVDAGQVLGVVAQLDAAAGERRVDDVCVAFQRDGGGAGDLAALLPQALPARP